MSGQTFSLEPFPGTGIPPDLRITATVARQSNRLMLGYMLRGDLSALVIPALAENPMRKHDLWEGTCFECFIAPRDSPGYWECNLSPAGHWNVYRFDDYRQNMREEPAFAALPFVLCRQPDALTLDLAFDLAHIAPVGERIQVGISAVLRHTDGTTTYWALAHCGREPDFHLRESFAIEL